MLHDLGAEITVQLRRPANWLILAAAVGLTLAFAYVIPYAAYGTEDERGRARRLLAEMLPQEFTGAAIGGLPVFVGALALIFGVLLVGNDYAWETWKTVLVQQPSRGAVLAGKLGMLALGTLALVLTLFTATASASLLIAGMEGASPTLPRLSDAALDAGAGWLIAFTWGMLGVCLAIVMRGVALPVGVGLVWMLAVQNLISALAAPLLAWVDQAQQWLPGAATGSLVASLTGREDTPGVSVMMSAGQAAIVVGAYLLTLSFVSVALFRARDLT